MNTAVLIGGHLTGLGLGVHGSNGRGLRFEGLGVVHGAGVKGRSSMGLDVVHGDTGKSLRALVLFNVQL